MLSSWLISENQPKLFKISADSRKQLNDVAPGLQVEMGDTFRVCNPSCGASAAALAQQVGHTLHANTVWVSTLVRQANMARMAADQTHGRRRPACLQTHARCFLQTCTRSHGAKAGILDSLQEWRKEFLAADFKKTQERTSSLALEKQDAWAVLCKTMRTEACEGFPVSIDFMPNAQNKLAMDALNSLATYASSRSFKQAIEEAISHASILNNGFCLVFELQKRIDESRGLMAGAFRAYVSSTAAGEYCKAPETMIKNAATFIGDLRAQMEETNAFIETAKTTPMQQKRLRRQQG